MVWALCLTIGQPFSPRGRETNDSIVVESEPQMEHAAPTARPKPQPPRTRARRKSDLPPELVGGLILLVLFSSDWAFAAQPSLKPLDFYPRAVSADGSVVVGDGAIRWTAAGGMVFLGSLPGHQRSMAWDVSADGS